ncbi:hypothetical protein [Archangium violaceum]|uniref:hypothetical protein n=1 Tax=Archangium violaceum TaxID=83451 RepID=UPI001269BB12|nr:hypothetical protein [Archangium violaceum]
MLDLFNPIVPDENQHKHFRTLLEPTCTPERAVLAQWSKGFIDRDGKFITEFQKTFNSCFWELYLNAAFRELDFTLDFSHRAPDFYVQSPDGDFLAEAVTANQPDGFRPEWEWDATPPEDLDEFLRLATIRLSNSLRIKLSKYKKSYASQAHVREKPFVVCIAPFEQPASFLQNTQAITRVLYGFDQVLTIKNGQQITPVGEARMSKVLKDFGAEVPLANFTSPAMKEISAVIFSNTATWGKVQARSSIKDNSLLFSALRINPESTSHRKIKSFASNYHETLLDGLHIFLNPYAKHPLNIRGFMNREIAIHSYDPRQEIYRPWYPDGFLVQRSTLRLFFAKNKSNPSAHQEKPSRSYRTATRPNWEEGKLQPADAETFLFTDNHLAHWRGWTILIAKDVTDGDWLAQAVQQKVMTVPEFMRANGSPEIASMNPGLRHPEQSYPTKQAALDACITEINAQLLHEDEKKEH